MSTPPPKDHKVQRPFGPWVPSSETDVTRTWDEARRKLEEERARREQIVKQLPKRFSK